jgi:hypothetical protein
MLCQVLILCILLSLVLTDVVFVGVNFPILVCCFIHVSAPNS